MAKNTKGGRKSAPQITIAEIMSLDTPEIRLIRASANGFEVIESAIEGTTREKRRKIETPFENCRRRKWIAPHQLRAAEILSNSFQKAGLMPSVTMRWSSFVDGSSWHSGSEVRGRHETNFRAAIKAIPEEHRDAFLTWFIESMSSDVTIEAFGALLIPAKHKEARKWVGIHTLQSVLNHLAFHYGVTTEKKRSRR